MSPAPRIATVTLNPAVDQTVLAPGFSLDTVNRAISSRTDAGGKGVNVASFLAHYKHKVTVLGLLGEDNDKLFTRHFSELGIVDDFSRVSGATRTNIKIVDHDTNRITDLNFPGPAATAADLEAVERQLIVSAAEGLDWLVLAGSLPKGLPEDSYLRFIKWARMAGCKTVVDTSGLPLRVALSAKPYVVKPNVEELRYILGGRLETSVEVAAAGRELVQEGIGLAVISMGGDGAVFVSEEGAVHAIAAAPYVASTVGAGDAMVAGLVHAHVRGFDLREMARISTGFSLGALGEVGPRLPEVARVEELAQTVCLAPV
ncbi:1-phosphofructokinase [Pseudovibrio exalbescens]|uniref:1-phosphofructokinase n=1 Tax=Pseudovibrio exalbescens TaxID=197461 RepID=UPI0023664DA1|nr:1-phosphofructokinase [Pseudovibrio exalbescens]MDD7910012.1 1-phosphofructokinase [Pseudovibrio exalbescens]